MFAGWRLGPPIGECSGLRAVRRPFSAAITLHKGTGLKIRYVKMENENRNAAGIPDFARGPKGEPNRLTVAAAIALGYMSRLANASKESLAKMAPKTRRQYEALARARVAESRFRMEPELSGTFMDTASTKIEAHRDGINGLRGRKVAQTLTVNARNAAVMAAGEARDESRTYISPFTQKPVTVTVRQRVNLSDPFYLSRAECHVRLGLDIGAIALHGRR